MLKRAALMLLVVPVQMFNFSLARNFLHGLRPHSQEMITEEVSVTERVPCSGSVLYGNHIEGFSYSERMLKGRLIPNAQEIIESRLSENNVDEEMDSDTVQKVEIEESACNEDGCDNP